MSKGEKLLVLLAVILLVTGAIIMEKELYEVIGFIAICTCIYLALKSILTTDNYEKANANAKKNYKRYKMAIDALNGAICEWNDNTKKLYLSSRIKDVLQIKANINSFDELYKFIIDSDRDSVRDRINNICENKIIGKFNIEFKLQNTKGNIIIVTFNGMGRFKENIFYISGVLRDITEKINQQQLIKEGNKKYKIVVEGSNSIIFCIDVENEIITFDKKILNYFNKSNESYSDIYDDVVITLEQWESFIFKKDIKLYNEKMKKIYTDENCYKCDSEYRLINRDNKVIWVSSSCKKSIGDDGKTYIYGSLTDITDRKEKELKIYFMSYYDEVTGIANRRFFAEKLNESIRTNKNDESIALIFIDLDNFKYINDTYGHELGDALLVSICEQIYALIDKKSHFARFAGDEFVIAKTGVKSSNEVSILLDRILDRFNHPINVNEKKLYCTLSIGVSLYPFDGEDIDSLLKKADMAMYKAKSNGKNRYHFFDMNILNELNREFEIEKGLRTALEEDEIKLVFQAKVDTITEEIVGYEGLCRWNSEKLGPVSPVEFIPIAERTGLIINIGKFIIDYSIKMCKQLSLLTVKKFKIAINLSDVQIRDESIIGYIADTLKHYNLCASYIEFEITESLIMKSVEQNIECLKKLKEIGVSIALDDFGTGYSSLSYLKILPIDVLKIDKTFIDGINVDEKSEYIIERIVDLSHHLDIKVVAEGVETKEQVEYLRSIDCDIIQGYYYSKPIPFGVAKRLIENQCTLV